MTFNSGSQSVSDSLACSLVWTLCLLLGYLFQPWYEHLWLVSLYLVMPCSVDITGRPSLFWRAAEEQWIWGRGVLEVGQSWEEGREGDFDQDILYERRKKKKKTVQPSYGTSLWSCLTSLRPKPMNHSTLPLLVRHSLLSSNNCLVFIWASVLPLSLIPTACHLFICCLTYAAAYGLECLSLRMENTYLL